jgi:hypothetical protein
MDVKRLCAGVCWFAAACLTVLALVLVLAGIIVNAGEHWSTAGFVLAILAGTALVLMGALMSLGFRSEHHDDTDRIKPGAP